MGCCLVLSLILSVVLMLIPTMTPPPVPTVPTFKVKRPCRPHWVAEIYMGKFRKPKRIVIEAATEAEAVMKLITPPLNFNPRDITLHRKSR